MKKSEVLKLIENYSYIRNIIDREEKLRRIYEITYKIRYWELKHKKSYTKNQVLEMFNEITKGDFSYKNIENDDEPTTEQKTN